MEIEFEAKFLNINKNEIRKLLTTKQAKCIKPEFLQKRSVYHLPSGHTIPGAWVRVRDEVDRITLSLKVVSGKTITDQKEICLIVDSFQNAEDLLLMLGCEKKAYQESKREIWQLDACEIMIDEWPYVEPYIEIEGPDEKAVKNLSKKLGFDYSNAIFGAADSVIAQKYEITTNQVNNQTPRITFTEPNPYLTHQNKHS